MYDAADGQPDEGVRGDEARALAERLGANRPLPVGDPSSATAAAVPAGSLDRAQRVVAAYAAGDVYQVCGRWQKDAWRFEPPKHRGKRKRAVFDEAQWTTELGRGKAAAGSSAAEPCLRRLRVARHFVDGVERVVPTWKPLEKTERWMEAGYLDVFPRRTAVAAEAGRVEREARRRGAVRVRRACGTPIAHRHTAKGARGPISRVWTDRVRRV